MFFLCLCYSERQAEQVYESGGGVGRCRCTCFCALSQWMFSVEVNNCVCLSVLALS